MKRQSESRTEEDKTAEKAGSVQDPNEEDSNEEEEDDVGDEYDEAPPVQCWDEAVTVTEALIHDAKTLWENYGGDQKTAKSFWVDADAEPRCLIEATALQMAEFHLQGVEYAGVEIWTQFRASDASNFGLDFHFDKDERKAAEENSWKHPVVGTASYLTTGGAPLVVFATASPEGGEEPRDQEAPGNEKDSLQESSPKKQKTGLKTENEEDAGEEGPSHAWICYPVKGRHVAFAGNLLHGVTQELIFNGPADRLSLLVNIWLDHKPDAVEPLSDEVAKKLDPAVDGAFTLGENGERKEPLKALELQAHDELEILKGHIQGDTAPLPRKAIREHVEKKDKPPLIQISYFTG